MADGRKELGSQTYDQHLEELIEAEQITAGTKRAALAPTGPAPVISYSRRGPGKAASK
jgi:hypothetical protein